MSSHSATPWSFCGQERGGCSCLQIWTNDHPIAEAVGGKWGDEYPALRINLNGHAEPLTDMHEYGEISMDLAKANVAFIVRACNSHEALVAALRIAEAALSDIGDADREPSDDLGWCEARSAEALPTVRAALALAEAT